MNKELYNNIKNELDSLSEEVATASYVSHLLGRKLIGKTSKDNFTVIYTFYEYMSQRASFNFINTGEWAAFFRNNLSNYLNSDNIKSDFDEIINDEKLLNTILKVCNDDVKKDLYECAKKENAIHIKTGSNKYVDVYKKIEESLIKDGLIEKKDKDEKVTFSSDDTSITSKSIDDEIENLKKRQEDLENEKFKRRDSLFETASNSVGIDTDKLIKRVGKDESLNIDAIEVDPQLVSKLSANSAVAATMPNGLFHKLKERIKKSIIFRNIELEIVEIDEKKTLTMQKKESIFDKIASSDNEIVRAIYNSAKEKLALIKSLVKPSEEVITLISEAVVNTSEKIKKSVLKKAEDIQREYSEFKEAAKETFSEGFEKGKTVVSDKINNFANRVSDYGISTREKAAGKLYSIADKLTAMNNARVIMKSGTKSGEISNPYLLEEGKSLSA